MKLNRKQKKTVLVVAQFLLPAARYLGMYIYLRDSGAKGSSSGSATAPANSDRITKNKLI